MDRVWIIPAPANPWKSWKPVDLEIRVKLVKSVLEDWGLYSERSKISVLSIPTLPDFDGRYYSVDQLREILREYSPDFYSFYIVGGSDIISKISDWKEGNWILSNFDTLDIGRPGYGGTTGTDISSTKIRELVGSGNWEDLGNYLSPSEVRLIKKYELYVD